MPQQTQSAPAPRGALPGKLRFWLWDAEIPVFKKNHPLPAMLLTVVLAAGITGSLLTSLHNDALFLGPGSGLEPDTQPFRQLMAVLDSRYAGGGSALLAFAALSASVIFALTVAGYYRYRKTFGAAYPLREHLTFPAISFIDRFLFLLATLGLGIAAWTMGLDFEDGRRWVVTLASGTNDWVMTHVPTVVELPYVAAFFVSYGIAGFVHYGLHRLGHDRRFFWLLFHRFHHMPTVMFPASTPPVFFNVPLFLLVVVPYHLAFAGLTKLFCDQPLYFAFIFYKLLFYIPDCWAHNTAMYDSGRNSRWVRWCSLFFSNGIYHYVHHTSEVIEGRRANSVNLGGSFLYLPDRLFGTFRELPARAPVIGLTGLPTLHYHPLRLALSGMAQLYDELRHNHWRHWPQILFGSADYTPPHSRDFALKEKPAV